MVVVADASPLIFLARIGLSDLLQQLFGTIAVPRTVMNEVTHGGGTLPGAPELQDASWLQVVDFEPDAPLQRSLTKDLGAGESAAILLALEAGADLLLVDDRAARVAARRLDIPIRGSLGFLLDAKRRGLLTELAPYVEGLREAGAWLSEDLVKRVLSAAGEAKD